MNNLTKEQKIAYLYADKILVNSANVVLRFCPLSKVLQYSDIEGNDGWKSCNPLNQNEILESDWEILEQK